MDGYQRFVAYVYEYNKGRKGRNCGFLKVEVREGQCIIEVHLQCPGLAAGSICRIYGFVRRDGAIEGVLLGEEETTGGKLECLLETRATDLDGSGVRLEQLGGMILKTDMGASFGTEWDDQPISFEKFRVYEPEKKAESEKAAETEIEPDIEPDGEAEATVMPIEQEADFSDAKECDTVSEVEITEVRKEDEAELPDEAQIPEEAQVPEEAQISEEPHEEKEMMPRDEQPKQTSQEEPVQQTEQKSTQKSTLPVGEDFCPFEDWDLLQCKKIRMQDLGYLGRRFCAFRNNRFLQHGYYHFGHLLLAQKETGQFLLGVPGAYNQQEAFMAGMFGFPDFRESDQMELVQGKGGYWYRLIDAADFNQRNRS